MRFIEFLHEILCECELVMGDCFQLFLELMVEFGNFVDQGRILVI